MQIMNYVIVSEQKTSSSVNFEDPIQFIHESTIICNLRRFAIFFFLIAYKFSFYILPKKKTWKVVWSVRVMSQVINPRLYRLYLEKVKKVPLSCTWRDHRRILLSCSCMHSLLKSQFSIEKKVSEKMYDRVQSIWIIVSSLSYHRRRAQVKTMREMLDANSRWNNFNFLIIEPSRGCIVLWVVCLDFRRDFSWLNMNMN